MNIVLIAVLVIIALPFVLALFAGNEFTIEKNIIISKPLQQVFDYIRLLKNSANYNKWVMQDPNLKKDFTGTDGTVGFVYYWDSAIKQVGKGEQEITGIKEAVRVDYEIRFIRPFAGTSYAYLLTEEVAAEQTKVTWVFTGTKNYLMKLLHIIFKLEKVLGKDLAESLSNLKTVLEK